jgi:CheY-like chemotaxis protein
MDISIIVSGNMEVHTTSFSLDNLLEEVKAEFKEACKEKHIKLTIQKPERNEDIYLNSDPELLHKIWYQLLSNAVKFTSKGEINFGIRETSEGFSYFVTDTGIGIEADKSQLIFDYFMQADISQTRIYEGSGLGLSIARDLVKLLGGQIYVESVKNEGTTFLFTLTETKSNSIAERPELRIQKAELKQNPLILVAEDDDFNYKYLDIILKRANYLVVRAVNGLEAIDICRKNKDVSMILMDMKMPKMGGLEATREIRKFMPDLPVIALTAYVSPVDENEAAAAGCNEFVSKPVNRTKLLSLMQKVLGNQDWEGDNNG